MSKFIITEEFWTLFPEAEIAVVLAAGIENGASVVPGKRQEIAALLARGCEEAKVFLTAETLSENAVIAVWRQAFQKFKTKKGVRSSIEALLKRIDRGIGVGGVNPLVDLYNYVSLRYGLPCGGEDIDSFRGDMLLTTAEGGEAFLALGDEAFDNALPGEIIYKDDEGAICRCWNWRDGQRTMLTEDTRNAFLIIESVDPARAADLRLALATLAELTKGFLGGEMQTHILTKNNREITLT